MHKKLKVDVLRIDYQAFDESIWDLRVGGLKVQAGDNCLTTEDHRDLAGQTVEIALGLEFVQLEANPSEAQGLTLENRPASRRCGSDIAVSGRLSERIGDELYLLDGPWPIYLHLEDQHEWHIGDYVQARGLLCVMLEES
jgi:hypothetical protein